MITLSLRKLLLFLTTIAVLIAIINLALGAQQYLTGSDDGLLYEFFDVNEESNVPTWFSVIVLFCSSLTVAIISLLKTQKQAPFWRFWWGASAIFLYLSLDEGARIHEQWDDPESPFGSTLAFGELPLEIVIIGVTALVFARFFLHLPKQTKVQLLLAATFYVGGIVVVDKLSVIVVDLLGSGVITGLLAITEEFLEQLGAILFLYTFLTYLKTHEPAPTLKLS